LEEAFTSLTDIETCFARGDITDWQFNLEVAPSETSDDGCDGSIKVRVQQWFLCKPISWIDILVCQDGADTEGTGYCTTKKGGRINPAPGDWVEADAACCANNDGTKELKFVVIIHEGGFGCDLADGDVPWFNENCNGNSQDSVAFEINLGEAFCNNCYVDKTYSFSLPKDANSGSDVCYDADAARRDQELPFLL
jgi:hypothetical protein